MNEKFERKEFGDQSFMVACLENALTGQVVCSQVLAKNRFTTNPGDICI